jgi:DNA-directed RNA polymerase specialized sigma24 family protein
MSAVPPVTDWLNRLKDRDPAAAQKLWDCYFERLVRLARAKLQAVPRRAADEEDVALSAFDSFCRRAEHGQFNELLNRNHLWRLLATITARKALDQVNLERRQKRGGGRVRGDSALADAESGFDGLADREPTPAEVALVADECRRLLGLLDDDGLRTIALWKMEAYTNQEIADRLKCSLRRVERKVQLIRAVWEKSCP